MRSELSVQVPGLTPAERLGIVAQRARGSVWGRGRHSRTTLSEDLPGLILGDRRPEGRVEEQGSAE